MSVIDVEAGSYRLDYLSGDMTVNTLAARRAHQSVPSEAALDAMCAALITPGLFRLFPDENACNGPFQQVPNVVARFFGRQEFYTRTSLVQTWRELRAAVDREFPKSSPENAAALRILKTGLQVDKLSLAQIADPALG